MATRRNGINLGLESQILPHIMIKNVTIAKTQETEKEKTYKSKVNVLIKEKINNDFNMPNWFGVHNFSEYMKVVVIQLRSRILEEEVLKKISPEANLKNLKTKSGSVEGFLEKLKANNKLRYVTKSLKDIKSDIGASIGDSAAVQEFHSTTDITGEVIYDIPYEAVFEEVKTETSISYLSYLVYVTFDISEIMKDHNTSFTEDQLGVNSLLAKFSGQVKRIIALVNGTKLPSVQVYNDMDGNIWYGPVHIDPQTGEYYTGAHSGVEPRNRLSSRMIRNNKVIFLEASNRSAYSFYGGDPDLLRDSRPFGEISKANNSAEDLVKLAIPKPTSGIKMINSQAKRKIVKSLLNQPGVHQQIGKIALSTSPSRAVNFHLEINYERILESRIRHANILQNASLGLRSRMLQSCRISHMRLLRRRVTPDKPAPDKGFALDTQSDHRAFDPEEGPELICEFSELKGIPATKKEGVVVGEISPLDNNNHVKTFTGADYSMEDINHGVYQYYIEMRILDNSSNILRELWMSLEDSVIKLENLYGLLSIPRAPARSPLVFGEPSVDLPEISIRGSYNTKTGFYHEQVDESIDIARMNEVLEQSVDNFFTALEAVYPALHQLRTFYRKEIAISVPEREISKIFESPAFADTMFRTVQADKKREILNSITPSTNTTPVFLKGFIDSCQSLLSILFKYIGSGSDLDGMLDGEHMPSGPKEIFVTKYFKNYYDANHFSKELAVRMFRESIVETRSRGMATISLQNFISENALQAAKFNISEDRSLGWMLPASYISGKSKQPKKMFLRNQIAFQEDTNFKKTEDNLKRAYMNMLDKKERDLYESAKKAPSGTAMVPYGSTPLDETSKLKISENLDFFYEKAGVSIEITPPGQAIQTTKDMLENSASKNSMISESDEESLSDLIKDEKNQEWYSKQEKGLGLEKEKEKIDSSEYVAGVLESIQEQVLTDQIDSKGNGNNLTMSEVSKKMRDMKSENEDIYNKNVCPMVEAVVSGKTEYSSDTGTTEGNLSPFYHGMTKKVFIVMNTSGQEVTKNQAKAFQKGDYSSSEGEVLKDVSASSVKQFKEMVGKSKSNKGGAKNFLMKVETHTCEDVGLGKTQINEEIPVVDEYFILKV
jgi:hypothetical protein